MTNEKNLDLIEIFERKAGMSLLWSALLVVPPLFAQEKIVLRVVIWGGVEEIRLEEEIAADHSAFVSSNKGV